MLGTENQATYHACNHIIIFNSSRIDQSNDLGHFLEKECVKHDQLSAQTKGQ